MRRRHPEGAVGSVEHYSIPGRGTYNLRRRRRLHPGRSGGGGRTAPCRRVAPIRRQPGRGPGTSPPAVEPAAWLRRALADGPGAGPGSQLHHRVGGGILSRFHYCSHGSRTQIRKATAWRQETRRPSPAFDPPGSACRRHGEAELLRTARLLRAKGVFPDPLCLRGSCHPGLRRRRRGRPWGALQDETSPSRMRAAAR
jgi:hypothetical protein